MFRTTAITLFLASASVVNGRELCFDNYEETINLALGTENCRWKDIFNPINAQFKVNRDENKAAFLAAKEAGEDPLPERIKCTGGGSNEIMALTNTESIDDAKLAIKAMCNSALLAAADNALEDGDWSDVEGTDVDLDDFFAGKGFLNTETGNFQQEEGDFKGGYDKFIYIGDDPLQNDHYPTTEESYNSGAAIKGMFDTIAKTTTFSAPTGNFECASNVAMCCWHRDRQYFDNNGNCNEKDCANQTPGDNTDLCWTKDASGTIFPYPGDDTEGDLHCHGLGWSNNDEDGNYVDVNSKTRFNTLFFVSMYDHLYQRGYAESITNDPNIEGEVPMCGCVEEMPAVARADCSEIDATTEYTATVVDGELVIAPVEGTFVMDFQACEGIKYVDGYTPEAYIEDVLDNDRDLIKGTDNDLAGFVFKQYLTSKINPEQYETFQDTVVGYYRNDIQNKGGRDARREETCEDVYLEKFGGSYTEAAV